MSDFSFLDDEAAKPQYTGATVKTLTEYVETLRALEALKVEQEAALASTTEDLRKLSQVTIPTLLQENGVDAISVPGIGKVLASLKYKASVPSGYWGQFKAWLKGVGMGAVIKEATTIENAPPEVLEDLAKKGVMFDTKPAIHHQTLAKLARELAEAGHQYPESFSVYTYYETSITKK